MSNHFVSVYRRLPLISTLNVVVMQTNALLIGSFVIGAHGVCP